MRQLTLRQAEAMLGLAKDSLRRQAGRGTIKAYKMGRDWIVDFDEVQRYDRDHRRRRLSKVNSPDEGNRQAT
jgi:excisionase family DNA binding protein